MKYILKVFAIFFIFNSLSCFSNNLNTLEINTKKKELKLSDGRSIDLSNDLNTILESFNTEYIFEQDPFSDSYLFQKYNILIFFNRKTKKIDEIQFIIYNENFDLTIDKLKINNLTIDKKTDFEKMKQLLNKNNISFLTKEYSNRYAISPKEHAILQIYYLKEDLKIPRKISVKL